LKLILVPPNPIRVNDRIYRRNYSLLTPGESIAIGIVNRHAKGLI